jgi:hypothetical protein
VPACVIDVPAGLGVLRAAGVVAAVVGVPAVVVVVVAGVPVVAAVGVPTWPNAEPAPASANASVAMPAAMPNPPNNFLVADTLSS